MIEKLHIYYTNDLHSNFEQWPRVAGYLKHSKEKTTAKNEDCWLIDIGDHIDRVHPIAEASMGKANIQLMNEVGYDVVTLGNNEGITLDHHDLFHLYDEADFDVVCANLHSLDHMEPDWLKPFIKMESKSGIKIGFIGLTARFNAYYELLNWHISSQYKAIDKYITELKKSADVIVLLSHLGISEDQAIARRYPEIDVIIGGHTHHLLRTGEYVNNTVITAAGKHCEFAGEVILTWDHSEQKLIKKEAYTVDTTHMTKDLQTVNLLNHLQEETDKRLGEPIVNLKKPIEVKWFEDTPIIQELTNTVKAWTKADCAMLNSGLLLDQLPAGNVTYKDIHRICPHPINPVVVELNGDELMEVIRATFTKDFMELKLKGFGFRGKVLGRMMFSGIEVETDIYRDGNEYVTAVHFPNGEALEPNRKYTVATADVFTFGRLLPPIAKSEVKHYFLPEFLRDLLVDTLKSKFIAS